MEPFGALSKEGLEAKLLKRMVGPCGLERQTSTVSKIFRHKRTSQPNVPSVPARGHKVVSGATVAGGGTMRVRYQRGYLRLGQRKNGPDRWEFLWWESEPSGLRVRRKTVIGTVLQYPNLENAWLASNGLRASINEARNRQREQAITIADLFYCPLLWRAVSFSTSTLLGSLTVRSNGPMKNSFLKYAGCCF
jgi:hypothetical protein